MLRHADQERMILLNSWEGVYFDINLEGMNQMMRDIKSMGGELFVMDDGWFGEKYPRLTDNADALQRIFMQWGTSYFFQAIAMASHISAVPNHAVFRTTSLKLRCDVAMSGRLGMEIQPKNMTDEEKAFCRQVISEYKKVRPVIQFGDLYRLHSPYKGDNMASEMYVSADKQKAVFFWWKLETFKNQHIPRVKMAGLDADRMYTVHELNRIDLKPLPCEGKTYSGAFLMQNGLEMPYTHDVEYSKKNDWASRVLLLEEYVGNK